MGVENIIAVCSPNERVFFSPFRMYDFATVDHTIYEDNSLTIQWSFTNDWIFFDAPAGSYKHHTRLLRASGGSNFTYNNEATLVAPTTDIYLSNNGSAPGNTYSSAASSVSETYLTFKITGSTQISYFIKVGSMRGDLAASEVVEGFVIKSLVGTTNFLPFE